MARVRLTNYGKEYILSDVVKIAHHSMNESLIFLGPPKEDKKRTYCIGVGVVKKIEKGESFDIVRMDFGKGYWREIIVRMNHARRQIYTLKCGQLAWFYGFAKTYAEGRRRKIYLFARGLQGWFTPKNLDIKKLDPEDIEELTKENESKLDFIDELLKGEDY